MKHKLKSIVLKILAVLFPDNGPKVIYYHDVGRRYTSMGTEFALFKSHIAAAKKNGFRFVTSVDELCEPKTILLCFDDGFRGVWDERDYFEREGLKPVVFIAVDLIGQDGYLDWGEIRELQQRGFSFQSHTWTHRPLTEVPNAEWGHEIKDSRDYLSERLGNEVRMLCFPCGNFSFEIFGAAKEAGYKYCVSSIPSRLEDRRFCDVGLIPRCLVQALSEGEFLCVLRGALRFFTRRYFSLHYQR